MPTVTAECVRRSTHAWLRAAALCAVASHAVAQSEPTAQSAPTAPAPPPDPAATPSPPTPPAPPPAEPTPAAPAPTTDAQKALEADFAAALASEHDQPAPPEATSAPAAGGLSLIDIAFDLLGAGGGSTASEGELRSLEGGGHDPKNRGFTIQNAELTFSGVVDPYLRGDASIVLQIDERGESIVELEEAYLTSLDLPLNLQLKTGQFFAAFGRLNPIHPHGWDFVDQPVVNSRLLGGEGFRNPGVQLSWLTPLPFFAELVASVHNAQGETAPSFRSTPGELVAGRTLVDRDVRSLRDLVYLLRLRTSFEVGDEVTVIPGLSVLLGPNATADDTRTEIYGADLHAKWKPLSTDHGWPFVAWQTEAMYRRYQAAAVLDGSTVADGRRTLDDYGLYSQLLWGFVRSWQLGVRYDYARGRAGTFTLAGETYSAATDPLRDERHRGAAMLTYYPSEFSKLRLQYNFDHAQFLRNRDAHSVYLQAEILFGAHGAHRF